MEYVTRAEWGARDPDRVITVSRSLRTEFIVHYSAASQTQTVRSIQNYHMDTRGWDDIGYNWLCDVKGTLYIGRGWDTLGTHTVGHNTSGIAVCFIGTNADVTEAAKRTIRMLADEADRVMGRKLTRYGHRDLDQTTCPGDNLYGWVHSGMSVPLVPPLQEKEEDMGRLTFFKADGKYWRSNAARSGIRAIKSGTDFQQVADRGDAFPDADENGFPKTDIILDPVRGGWTWEQIHLAYGPMEE